MVKKKGVELETVDFECSLQELETIVRRLEQGGGALEQALGDYAQAIILLKACHGRLEQAERKIEILSGVDANGAPVVREIDDEELSLEDKQENRGQRRAVPRGSIPPRPPRPPSTGPSGKSSQNTDAEGSLF
jgi:exodeoxyribonuclease VII small subunit